jgi:hypothetical protein
MFGNPLMFVVRGKRGLVTPKMFFKIVFEFFLRFVAKRSRR